MRGLCPNQYCRVKKGIEDSKKRVFARQKASILGKLGVWWAEPRRSDWDFFLLLFFGARRNLTKPLWLLCFLAITRTEKYFNAESLVEVISHKIAHAVLTDTNPKSQETNGGHGKEHDKLTEQLKKLLKTFAEYQELKKISLGIGKTLKKTYRKNSFIIKI